MSSEDEIKSFIDENIELCYNKSKSLGMNFLMESVPVDQMQKIVPISNKSDYMKGWVTGVFYYIGNVTTAETLTKKKLPPLTSDLENYKKDVQEKYSIQLMHDFDINH